MLRSIFLARSISAHLRRHVEDFTRLNITRMVSTTQPRLDIMEFFDDPKNWGQNEVKHGRAWTMDELRIKSASDLHKLWFILLKERNMLMTMEHEYKEKHIYFPSPERMDKVKISMANLEAVVQERNKAYYELETGESRVRAPEPGVNELGFKQEFLPEEHLIPKQENTEWKKSRRYNSSAVQKFVLLQREKEYAVKRREKHRNRNHVMHLLRRFPDMDINLLKEKYPDVDIDRLLRDDKIRPHI